MKKILSVLLARAKPDIGTARETFKEIRNGTGVRGNTNKRTVTVWRTLLIMPMTSTLMIS